MICNECEVFVPVYSMFEGKCVHCCGEEIKRLRGKIDTLALYVRGMANGAIEIHECDIRASEALRDAGYKVNEQGYF